MEFDQSELIFYFIGKNNIFAQYKVFGKNYDFNTYKIAIPNNIFDSKNEKKLIEFKLISKTDLNDEDELCFNLYIYYGINKVYCFVDKKRSRLYDICFLDKKNDLLIKYDDFILNEFNTLTNDTRARIVFINSPLEFKINNDDIALSIYIPFHLHRANKCFQIAIFDYDKNAYSSKVIKKDEIINDLLIVNVLKENKNELIDFYIKFRKLIKEEQIDEEIYKKLFANIPWKRTLINLSHKKEILEKYFNEEELYYLIYIYMLWLIFDSIFYPNHNDNKDNKNNEINSNNIINITNNKSNDDENKNNDNNISSDDDSQGSSESELNYSIFDLYNYITIFYENYKNDKELLNYQKVLLFCSNSIFFLSMNDLKAYNEKKLKYINVKNIEKNSVFGLS